jgi:hypothetical protein
MLDGYLCSDLRTPFGRDAGALARRRPDGMLAAAIAAVGLRRRRGSSVRAGSTEIV